MSSSKYFCKLVEIFVWSANVMSHTILLITITPAIAIVFANPKGRTQFFTYKVWGKDISPLDKLIRFLTKYTPEPLWVVMTCTYVVHMI